MPRRGILAVLMTILGIALIVGFRTSDQLMPGLPAAGTSGLDMAGTGATAAAGGPPFPDTSDSPTPTPVPGVSGKFVGPTVREAYGQVQVQITVKNGRITEVSAPVLARGGYSGQVSAYAASILRVEALNAQSARINSVSGATYTSRAYLKSLQGAIDAAHL